MELASSSRGVYLVSGEPWSTVRLERRAFGGILCLLRSNWSLRWLDVCICTDASEKGFAFAVREGCRELASKGGGVSERTTSRRSSRSPRARSRALRSIAPCVACPKGESRGLPGNVVATSGSLGMEIGGVRWFFREENMDGTCVAVTMSPPRQQTSCSSKVISSSAAIANLLHRACTCLGFWNTRAIRGSGTCRKSRLLRHSLARPGPWRMFACFGSPCRKRTLFLVGNVDGTDAHRVARKFVETGRLQRLPHHAQSFILHVTTPTVPVCLSRLPCFSP